MAAFLFIAQSLLAVDGLSTSALLEVLRDPAKTAGFGVQLGCGGGALTSELAKNERLAVHALEANELDVQRARALLQSQGVYGQVVVEQWTDSFLPYADNTINVLLAENFSKIDETEMLRVLAPLGTLWLKRDGAWRATQKTWPKEFDEWTHWRHGADGNMVSRDTAVQTPTGLRWIAGPAQDPGGRKWYYDHVLVSAAGRNFYVYENEIVARDSFNGRLLWARPAKAYIFKESGVPEVGFKIGNRTSKVRPVAIGSRLYVALDGQLVALDASTGATVQTFCEIKNPREIVVSEGLLLLSDAAGIRAFNLDGKSVWHSAEPARRIVAGDRTLFFLNQGQIVCLDLLKGQERWRTEHAKAEDAQTCAYYKGVLVLERSVWRDDATGSGIVVLDASNGKVLWSKEYKPGMTHFKEARTFFADGLIWVESMPSKKGDSVRWLGLDPQSGEQRKDWGGRGLHCSAPVATERYFISAEMEFTDLATGTQSRSRMVKGACRLPFIPANGLLYSFPVQCECFPMLRGYIGLAQKQTMRESSQPRLQPGPAYGRPASASVPKAGASDWPTYRHDAFRSGATANAIPEEGLQKLWEVSLAAYPSNQQAAEWKDDPFVEGLITSPVCASELLVLAVPDRHRVVALDAKTGAERWSFIAGGRVDLPPTLHEELCLFGAHDGYVYCLNLADGKLAWRFRAAPQEARIPVYGQMESVWPAIGSVLVENGVAYFSAGRHPMTDGGVYVCALRPHTGEVVWEKNLTDSGVKSWYSGFLPQTKIKVGLDFEPFDMLVRDGDKLAMSRWQFQPETGEVHLAFASTNYQAAAGLEIPRGIWSYGIRQNKAVLDKPPAVFSREKLYRASTNDAALLLAGSTLVTGTGKGELKIGTKTVLHLESPAVHDGIIAAGGRLYTATRDGKLHCFGAR